MKRKKKVKKKKAWDEADNDIPVRWDERRKRDETERRTDTPGLAERKSRNKKLSRRGADEKFNQTRQRSVILTTVRIT